MERLNESLQGIHVSHLNGFRYTTRFRPSTDLVFLQNGMLEPWLASKGLQDATQVR